MLHKKGMKNNDEGAKDVMEVSTPKVTTQSGPSIVWLIPLITLLVGG
jgi:paraquat-inducible protein B